MKLILFLSDHPKIYKHESDFCGGVLPRGSIGSRDIPYLENLYFCCAAIGCIEEILMSPEHNLILNFVTRRKVSLMHVIMCGSKVWPCGIRAAAEGGKL